MEPLSRVEVITGLPKLQQLISALGQEGVRGLTVTRCLAAALKRALRNMTWQRRTK